MENNPLTLAFVWATQGFLLATDQMKTRYLIHPGLALVLLQYPLILEHFARCLHSIDFRIHQTKLGFDAPTKVGVKYTKAQYFQASENMFFPHFQESISLSLALPHLKPVQLFLMYLRTIGQ